jgi:hypothetical protein
MYAIEKQPYGYRITFAGFIKGDEMSQWLEEAEQHLARQRGPFGVVVDMRDLKPLASDAQQALQTGQRKFKAGGMERSAVILQNPIITLQFKRVAHETGIDAWERYIDSSKIADFEAKATAWVRSGSEPDA